MRQALVTGAETGLGLAIAQALVLQGYAVTLATRQADQGAQNAAQLGCSYLVIDPLHPQTLLPVLGPDAAFDILVNVAPCAPEGALLADPDAVLDSLTAAVTTGFLLIRGLAPGMAARGWGRIVNVLAGGPVADAALRSLTQELAQELPNSLKINALDISAVMRAPGPDALIACAKAALWLATLPGDGPTGATLEATGSTPIR